MLRTRLVVLTAVACSAMHGAASAQFTFDPFNILSVRDTIKSVNLGPALGSYDGYAVSFDWQAVIGDPWSREAKFALASSADPSDPNLVVYKFIDFPNNGRADNAANNGDPVRLTWEGALEATYTGGDLWFLARQDFPGSQAHWIDISVTLQDYSITPPAAQFAGHLFDEDEAFTIDTFDSLFDTELALYDSAGRLLFQDDDAFLGNPGTSYLDLPGGLAEGRYYVALAGHNAVFGDEFGVDLLPGSEGGEYTLVIGGSVLSGTLQPGTVTWFSFGVVPAPGSLAFVAATGIICARRRR